MAGLQAAKMLAAGYVGVVTDFPAGYASHLGLPGMRFFLMGVAVKKMISNYLNTCVYICTYIVVGSYHRALYRIEALKGTYKIHGRLLP